ncbi:hypothetical protein PPSIR1_27418 [Plesiocystis pacifica SIR-1]|uniref:Lipoprotein n=1 Tax=Plesiocystis pacifica SIR-1 TaxID=391625 RepID=A6G4P8_9BACT|nr:hypothetical protein [Plesiocystis pacifica]EDM79168.1 hypothetical protein PPSIR1_27418 [Plesiocystis pacifica SIR-1]
MRLTDRRRLPLALTLALGCPLACGPELVSSDDEAETGSSEESTTTEGGTAESESSTEAGSTTEGGSTITGGMATDALDILFVVDNSGTMGPLQAALAQNIDGLINPLDDAGVDWRVAVTTTDNGNPWCSPGQTTPEGGNFVYSGCPNRLTDFVFGADTDVSDPACLDLCTAENGQLATEGGVPWLERSNGALNIELDDPSAALRCLLPQGINGCGFESPLESMYLAMVRSFSQGEDNFGFLRQDASLLVILVTDEADCSYNKDWSAIFDTDGNKVFWSDPNSPFPTSAVCWNAGVDCTGDPSQYDDCVAANKDVDGNATGDSQAVLHPVSRYTQFLEGLAADKQGGTVRVGLIAGVDTNGEPYYADVTSTDPSFQDSFGIGPGCAAPSPLGGAEIVQAVPPVRMLEAQGSLSAGAYSACNFDGYDTALSTMASLFVE